MDAKDNEIVATRLFDAPRELVFAVWTHPFHIGQWWGPNGFTITTEEIDIRPGGVWRHVMHGPDGTDYKNEMRFDEILSPEKIVYTHVPYPPFQSTITFTDENGKTRVTVRMSFETAELRNKTAETVGAVEGLNQTLGRCVNHLEIIKGSVKDMTLKRVFDAPRDVVFKMWTDPKHLTNWWGPGGFTIPLCNVDVRPGGILRIDMRAPNGVIYPMVGTYKEIVAPERLVFTGGALDESGKQLFEILNTVTFEEKDGKTHLTLHTHVLSYTPIAPLHFAGQEIGWSQSLERLEQYCLAQTRVR